MNIKIIKNTQEFNGVLLNDNIVLETKHSKSQYNGVNAVKYFLFDLENNRREEVLPKIKKFNLIDIIDASWNSKFIYFTNCVPQNHGKMEVNIIKYDYSSGEYDVMYSFYDDISLFPNKKHIKLFVLNDTYLIFQTSFLRFNQEKTFEDFLNFELFLYSIKDNVETKIIDENLTNNGIDNIEPISETHSVLKTGYSLLHNGRIHNLSKEETCVESISIINIQQLISDLLLAGSDIVIDAIDQAYYTKTFPYIRVQDDYLIYSAVNFETNEEEIFFYNNVTKETISCINQNVKSTADIAKPYIIDGNPYIKLLTSNGTEFFNITRAKIDVRFENDVVVNDVIDNFFIVSGITKRKFFGTYQSFLSIYRYPQMNLLHQEKAYYLGAISTDSNNLYLFVK